ncbi:MAG: hypothetical protein F4184_07520, partial [Gemmatimonadetes bacterium]|nr:hypothetical protein [Gemmatimonadota bacterium]
MQQEAIGGGVHLHIEVGAVARNAHKVHRRGRLDGEAVETAGVFGPQIIGELSQLTRLGLLGKDLAQYAVGQRLGEV